MPFPQIPISQEALKNHQCDEQYSPVSNAPSTPSHGFPQIPIAQDALKNHHCEEKYSPVSNTGAIFDTVSSCPMCGQLFYNILEMKKHLEIYHKKYQCDLCHKLMSHKRNVDRHRKSVHENQRGYGCPLCDYRSAHKQVLICSQLFSQFLIVISSVFTFRKFLIYFAHFYRFPAIAISQSNTRR